MIRKTILLMYLLTIQIFNIIAQEEFTIPEVIPQGICEMLNKDIPKNYVANYTYRIRKYNDATYEIAEVTKNVYLFFDSAKNEAISEIEFKYKNSKYRAEVSNNKRGTAVLFGPIQIMTFYQNINYLNSIYELDLWNINTRNLGLFITENISTQLNNTSSHHSYNWNDIEGTGINLEVVNVELCHMLDMNYWTLASIDASNYNDYCIERNLFGCKTTIYDNLKRVRVTYRIYRDTPNPHFTLNSSEAQTIWFNEDETILVDAGIWSDVNSDVKTANYDIKIERLTDGVSKSGSLNSTQISDIENGTFNLNYWCAVGGWRYDLFNAHYKFSITAKYSLLLRSTDEYINYSETEDRYFYVSDCHPHHTTTIPVYTNRTFSSQSDIDAGNEIYSPANVIYRAPGKINFLPGFKIENGATFKTETGNCTY